MKTRALRILLSLVVAFAALAIARTSLAAPKVASLAIKPRGEVAAVEGSPPTDAERLGTLLLAWCEAGPDRVVLAEISIEKQRMLRRKVVRQRDASRVSLARSRGRVILAIGGDDVAKSPLEVVAFDSALVEQASIELRAPGGFPSLVANDDTIAVASYEEREPVIARRGGADRAPWAPSHVLHLRVLDPSTLAVRNARVFEGKELLRPHFMGRLETHVLGLEGGRLYVALADVDPTVVALALPSLRTEAQRVLERRPRPFAEATSAAIVSANGRLVVSVLHGDVHVLAPSLVPIARVKLGAAGVFAANPKNGALFVGARKMSAKKVGEIPLVTFDVALNDGDDRGTVAWAFGRPILIAMDPSDDTGTSSAIVVGD